MKLTTLAKTVAAAAIAMPLMTAAASAYELVIPTLDYRTGAYAPNAVTFAVVALVGFSLPSPRARSRSAPPPRP